MTSVRSHRQRLSGNSILLLLCTFLFIQCKTQQHVVKNPTDASNRPDETPVVVDTIQWEEPEDVDVIVIEEETPTGEDVNESTKTNPGKLGVILPLNAAKMATYNSQIDARDVALIQYYQGFLLGLKALEEDGQALHVLIRDSKESPEEINAILEEFKARDVDYVFGSRGRENVQAIADYARDNDMIYANAWQVNSSFLDENDHYVQLNPGLQVHLTTILRHALNEFNPEDIILFGSKRESSRIDKINELYQEMTGASDPLETMIVETMTDLDLLEMEEWKPEEDDDGNIIEEGEQKVFIVPITRNTNLIHAFFRFLDFNAMHERSVVYGVTDWNAELLYDHLNNYDVRLTSFWNPRSSQEFSPMADRFFSENGTLPNEKAYEGYAHGMLIGRMVASHHEAGALENLSFDGGGMRVKLYDHNQLQNVRLDAGFTPSYFENGFVHLLGFKDYRYFELDNSLR